MEWNGMEWNRTPSQWFGMLAYSFILFYSTTFHPGTHTECLYSLMTFGIPMTDFPMTDDGLQAKRQTHHKWIERR
jgi:hypothetical protein